MAAAVLQPLEEVKPAVPNRSATAVINDKGGPHNLYMPVAVSKLEPFGLLLFSLCRDIISNVRVSKDAASRFRREGELRGLLRLEGSNCVFPQKDATSLCGLAGWLAGCLAGQLTSSSNDNVGYDSD